MAQNGSSPARKDSDGQSSVIKLEALSVKVDELIKLSTAADEASTEFSEAVNKVAEDAGLNAATVRNYVKARAGDGFEKKKAAALQLALVFEEVTA